MAKNIWTKQSKGFHYHWPMRTQSASKRNATVFIFASEWLKRWREISGPIRTKVFTIISQRERKVQASKLLEARGNTTVFIIASDRFKRWREISGPIRTKVFTMISQRERKVQASKLLEAGENATDLIG